MNQLTLRKFIKASSLPTPLIRAVVEHSGGWEEWIEHAPDIYNHGAAGGFAGFTYYSDTCDFYAKHRAAICTMAEQIAEELGEGAVEMVRGFRCLGPHYTTAEVGKTLYGNKRQHQTQVANALAWFALEEVARAYCDFKEED